MEVKVRNRFSAIRPVVDDETISCFFQLALPGDSLSGSKKMGKDRMILGGDGTMAGVVFFGNQEDVDRRLGSDVAKGEDMIILVEDVGLGLAVDDLFEDRFGHGVTRW